MKNPGAAIVYFDLLKAGVSEHRRVTIFRFVSGVNMDKSGSGIFYLGEDDFGIYDYPLAEEWLREECLYSHDYVRIGCGDFHYVKFHNAKGAVDFKLRWSRELDMLWK